MKIKTLLALLLLALPVAAVGQSASTASAGTSRSTPPGEVVQLSAFEVSSTANRGYVTTSSLSASRIAVPITELPSAVITINEKLIEDLVAVSLKDTMNFIGGLQSTGESNSQAQHRLTLRGNIVGSAQRDGVVDRLLADFGGFDYSLVERIEIVKGPSGVLYGSASPGGIVNFISKRPLATPRTRISASVGSFNSHRVEVDTSGFADREKAWGYRLAAAYAQTDGPIDFVGDPDGGLLAWNPSVSYRSKDGLYVWAWAAIVRDELNRLNRSAHGYSTGTDTGRVLLREGKEARGNNIFRNLTEVSTNNFEAGASKLFALGPINLTARLLGRWYDSESVGDRTRGVGNPVDMFLDASGNLLGGDSRLTDYSVVESRLATIARSQIRLDANRTDQKGSTYSADFIFAFKLGPTAHHLLAYASRDEFDGVSVNDTFTISNTATLTSLGAQLVGTQTRIQVWPTPAPQMLSLEPQTIIERANAISRSTSVSDNELVSFGAIERMALFDKRVFLVGGIREDRLDTSAIQTISAVAGTPTVQNDRSTTRNLAVLGKVYQGDRGLVSVFYNNNETFTPVFTRDIRLGPTFGERFPNRVAEIDEYGLKVDLFQSRLVATLAVYDIAQSNVLLQFNDQDGSVTGVPIRVYQAPVGVRTSEGWDVDLNFAPAPGWEVMLSYSKLKSKLAETGMPAAESPEKTFAAIGRYEFAKGPVKGLSLTWMYNYWGKSILGSRTNWWIPSGDQHSAVVGYRWDRWNVRLRVENVLDELHVLPSNFETAVGVTLSRNYRLGLSYQF